ncbi:MgtC/SapB family protein [Sphingopyxis terrae]|uniref:Protein MgtC n=1 Tax=Sphingopyxis terrae subsp. ummariensis TaxID=429001 RepID=A0A1Y6FNE0_9SPHN|nr:MgtC/SapB family protein [Sphingopyxis terrae]PCF91330.1 magnesium transporter [Sphingopyxis terrae subsp. ummariensis]SMQ76504.1 putative Mg2+ transporter-C (MgtC) family protein [Sphingopyxis terrae subsp. ummariensis]
MNIFDADLIWPLLGAIGAAILIGGEREYRSSPAGLRTHVLLGLSCALLMLAAVHQMRWLGDTPESVVRIDPVRMAHGILTGIGFLCGGVIFREGLNVRGLTTAASLWATATLGILFGVGFFHLALFGTAATLIVLAAVRLSEALLPQRCFARFELRFRSGSSIDAEGVRARLARHALRPLALQERMESGERSFAATVSGYRRERAAALVEELIGDPDIMAFTLEPQQS